MGHACKATCKCKHKGEDKKPKQKCVIEKPKKKKREPKDAMFIDLEKEYMDKRDTVRLFTGILPMIKKI